MTVLNFETCGNGDVSQSPDFPRLPVSVQASLTRLCSYCGGSEDELLARLLSDLERETLAAIPSAELDDYFNAAAQV